MGREHELFGEPVDLSEGVEDDDLGYVSGSNSATFMAPLAPESAKIQELEPKGPFSAGSRVRIVRVKTRDRGQRTGEIGRGKLIEEVRAGRPARLAVESGPALITSPVKAVTPTAPREIQIHTANSIYKIEQLD